MLLISKIVSNSSIVLSSRGYNKQGVWKCLVWKRKIKLQMPLGLVFEDLQIFKISQLWNSIYSHLCKRKVWGKKLVKKKEEKKKCRLQFEFPWYLTSEYVREGNANAYKVHTYLLTLLRFRRYPEYYPICGNILEIHITLRNFHFQKPIFYVINHIGWIKTCFVTIHFNFMINNVWS